MELTTPIGKSLAVVSGGFLVLELSSFSKMTSFDVLRLYADTIKNVKGEECQTETRKHHSFVCLMARHDFVVGGSVTTTVNLEEK